MKKKFIFILISLFIIFFEVASFTYFKLISKDQLKLNLYTEKRNSALSYKYFDKIGLVLPKIENKQDLIVTHYVAEFTDKFTFKDILGLGIGFPDDGIDNKKFKAIALGDSFTRGVGSIDNLKNGWVELVEKKNTDLDIINLGHLGWGINDQKYKYNKIKKFIDHDIILYNFFSINDYGDNLLDFEYSLYIEKFFKKYGKVETKKLINDLNIRHGYKHHLEYLIKNKYKSYSVYFILKISDYLVNLKIFPAYQFKYDIPKDEIRLKLVKDELFNLAENKNLYTFVCKTKYCYYEFNKEFVSADILDKIVLNSASKINQFYFESLKQNKKFIFILHPSAGHFYSNQSLHGRNKLDRNLLKLLDRRIKVINLGERLPEISEREKNQTFFYKYDGHYNVNGYKNVSNIISEELLYLLR